MKVEDTVDGIERQVELRLEVDRGRSSGTRVYVRLDIHTDP